MYESCRSVASNCYLSAAKAAVIIWHCLIYWINIVNKPGCAHALPSLAEVPHLYSLFVFHLAISLTFVRPYALRAMGPLLSMLSISWPNYHNHWYQIYHYYSNWTKLLKLSLLLIKWIVVLEAIIQMATVGLVAMKIISIILTDPTATMTTINRMNHPRASDWGPGLLA